MVISFFFLINSKTETEQTLKEEKDERSYGRGTPARYTHYVLGHLASRSLPRLGTVIRTLGTGLESEALIRYWGGARDLLLHLLFPLQDDAWQSERTQVPIVAQVHTGFSW